MKKRLACLLAAVLMILSILPVTAFAGDGKCAVAIGDCTNIGNYNGDDIFYCAVDEDCTTVEFTDFANETSVTVCGIFYTGYASTNEVGLTTDFSITKENLESSNYASSLDTTAMAGLDMSNLYAMCVMDDDYDMYYFIIQVGSGSTPTVSVESFTSDKGTISTPVADGYSYSGMVYAPDDPSADSWGYIYPTQTAPLYTLNVPAGNDSVTLTFPSERLAYAYDANGTYLGGYGQEADGSYSNSGQTGLTTATITATDGKWPEYVVVQTPYDSNWSSTTLYAVHIQYNYTFTASANGEALTDISVQPGAYSYTNYYGTVYTGALFTVTIPNDVTSVDLTFSDNVLAYNYKNNPSNDSNGNSDFLDGTYSGNTYMTGSTTATRKVDSNSDGKIDFIQVQTPYDSMWNSDTIYGITFVYESERPASDQTADDIDATVDDVYKTVGDALQNTVNSDPTASYNAANQWEIFGLSRAGYTVSKEAIQNLVDEINAKGGKLNTNAYDYSNYSRAIIALTAAGYDAQTICDTNLLEGISDLDAVEAQGLNGVIWALLAADTVDYEFAEVPAGKTQTTRDALVQDILNAQLPDGGWAYSGTSADVDMTAMAITALAPYYFSGSSDITVKNAVDKAVELLSTMQREDGTFASLGSDTSSSESTAQVIVALTSLGINPDTDSRFVVKTETTDGDVKTVSAIDGLCSFYTDGGFKHVEGGSKNTLATYQGYYALVSYYRFVEGKTALYDMGDLNPSDKIPADNSGDNGNNGNSDNNAPDTNTNGTPQTTQTTQTTAGVATGDTSVMFIWAGVIVCAAAVMGGVTVVKKRNER